MTRGGGGGGGVGDVGEGGGSMMYFFRLLVPVLTSNVAGCFYIHIDVITFQLIQLHLVTGAD